MLGFLDFDEVCGLDVLSRSAEEWAMVVQVYLKAVGLWKVLIPPGMLWSVVRSSSERPGSGVGAPLRRSACHP